MKSGELVDIIVDNGWSEEKEPFLMTRVGMDARDIEVSKVLIDCRKQTGVIQDIQDKMQELGVPCEVRLNADLIGKSHITMLKE